MNKLFILILVSLSVSPLSAQQSCYEQYLRAHNMPLPTDSMTVDDSYDELKKEVIARQLIREEGKLAIQPIRHPLFLAIDTLAGTCHLLAQDGTILADVHLAMVDSTWYMWLSVDPLADKYPGNTPYLYCNGNPIMFIDPDGREVLNEVVEDADPNLYKAAEHYREHYDDNNTIFLFAHGSNQNIILSDGSTLNCGEDVECYLQEKSQLWQNTEDKSKLNIVLMSCETGNGDNSIAEQVAKTLKETPVLAPTTEIIQEEGVIKGAYIKQNIKTTADYNLKNCGSWGLFLGDTKNIYPKSGYMFTISKFMMYLDVFRR